MRKEKKVILLPPVYSYCGYASECNGAFSYLSNNINVRLLSVSVGHFDPIGFRCYMEYDVTEWQNDRKTLRHPCNGRVATLKIPETGFHLAKAWSVQIKEHLSEWLLNASVQGRVSSERKSFWTHPIA